MEHIKQIAFMSCVVVASFAGLLLCAATPLWMAAAAGML